MLLTGVIFGSVVQLQVKEEVEVNLVPMAKLLRVSRENAKGTSQPDNKLVPTAPKGRGLGLGLRVCGFSKHTVHGLR
jgi:hypothetical protein